MAIFANEREKEAHNKRGSGWSSKSHRGAKQEETKSLLNVNKSLVSSMPTDFYLRRLSSKGQRLECKFRQEIKWHFEWFTVSGKNDIKLKAWEKWWAQFIHPFKDKLKFSVFLGGAQSNEKKILKIYLQ